MSDIEVIRELEGVLKVKLPELVEIGWRSRGYTRNENGKVTGVGVYLSGIHDFQSIVTLLEKFSQINFLDLSWNQINNLEPIKELLQIRFLNLSWNQIDDLTPLKELKRITELYLHNNQIRNLAPLEEFKENTALYLSNNKIRDLAPLKELKKLSALDLHNNQINDLTPLKELKKLSTLNLHNNQISDLTPLKELKKLSTLDLHNNQINDLTPLKEHTQLSSLNLYDNRIHSLAPLSKSALHTTLNLRIGSNPLEVPPPEIVQRGNNAINNYLSQLATQEEDYLFEAKMLIVGEPGAGKTSLARKIENEDCELPEKDATTKGIAVKPYYFELSKEDIAIEKVKSRDFRVNLWDFGGQEIYKSTHRFFLSKRSLYALVADSRNEDTDFNYWLHIVEMFGGDSPLLIVLNEKYQRKKTLDIPAMKARFSNIVDVISVDLADDDKTRLNQLTKEIRHQVSKLPHIGSPVPAKWTVVREVLEKDSHNTITVQDYLGICAKNSIKKIEDALVLSQYFHDIGVFLHFQDDPLLKNTIFLNSTWATQAVYQILDDSLLNEQDGRFSREDATKIWSAEEFTLLRDEFLALMKKFFLTYEIGYSGEYIVPERLPPNTPEYDWDEKDNLIVQYDYDFFMPKGILSQFIVQINRYIENHELVWKRGVILERAKTKAEVTESYDARKIKIQVSGENRRDFMTIITEKIDALNAQYEKMKVEKLIPCNCEECKTDRTPYFYEYTDLSRRIEKSRHEVECGRSYEMVNVRSLIDDVINERIVGKKNYASMTTRKKIFISYSHKDNEWLERVQVHLKGLRHLDVDAQAWGDTQINSGEKWYKEIKGALAESHAAILLISADFLASDFIANEELPELLHAAENDGLVILSVIVKPSLFSKTKLAGFQAVNDPTKPLSALSEAEQDKILVKLAERIIELVE